MFMRLLCVGCILLGATRLQAQIPRDWQIRSQQMVDQALLSAGIANPRVLRAMRDTPRHEFVPRNLRQQAYFDMALPIGEAQTISSPFIVAFMTECIDPQPQDRVLEIGTGSGYQAAVLSPLAAQVYSIEIVDSLGRKAARTLRRLRLDNVNVKIGDGFQGWPEHAPFDKIIVTCSPEKVPRALVEQLREGGRMVIPVGERYQQTMMLMKKVDGKLETEALRPTLFVPMTGTAEQKRDVQPDPQKPEIKNGDFEQPEPENGFVEGWYYQRQAQLTTDPQQSKRGQYVTLANQTPGRDCHLMQGLALDGRVVQRVTLKGWGKAEQIRVVGAGEGPRVVLTFYDDKRRDLGQWWLGPWRADGVWRQESKTIRVPKQTREAIVRIGLFGATGNASFDAVELTLP